MKIFAVYGNGGGGKSTVSGIIARHCAEKGLKTIIMSCDVSCPMMPIWLPQEKISEEDSLGKAFITKDMSIDVVAKRVQIYKPQQNIGFLAYTAEDSFIDYALDFQRIIEAIKMTRNICDVLVIDCASNLSDITVPAAIEMADQTICVLSPDLKGVSYYRSNLRLLSAEKFGIQNQIKILNGTKKYHAIKEISDAVNGAHYAFPFSPDIENAMLCGELVNTLRFCGKEYKEFLDNLNV